MAVCWDDFEVLSMPIRCGEMEQAGGIGRAHQPSECVQQATGSRRLRRALSGGVTAMDAMRMR